MNMVLWSLCVGYLERNRSYGLCTMADAEQVPSQQSRIRVGGWGAAEWKERRVWRWMLITSGAEGRALQVLPPQRAIDSGLRWIYPNRSLLHTVLVSSQPPEHTSNAQSITAKGLLKHNHFSFHILKPADVPVRQSLIVLFNKCSTWIRLHLVSTHISYTFQSNYIALQLTLNYYLQLDIKNNADNMTKLI